VLHALHGFGQRHVSADVRDYQLIGHEHDGDIRRAANAPINSVWATNAGREGCLLFMGSSTMAAIFPSSAAWVPPPVRAPPAAPEAALI